MKFHIKDNSLVFNCPYTDKVIPKIMPQQVNKALMQGRQTYTRSVQIQLKQKLQRLIQSYYKFLQQN